MTKKYLLILSLFAALIYSLNLSTYSVLLFTHNVFDISSPANDVSCISCHSKIADELSRSAYHRSLSCEDCHRNPYIGQDVAISNGTSIPGEEAHAAVKPRCLDCHSKTSITLANGTTVAVPFAKAFGEANYGSDYSAHKKFVLDSLNSNLAVGENEACLSCHTEFKVEFKFVRPLYLNFTIDTTWNLTLESAGPDNTTVVIKYGNGSKHVWKPISKISCMDCHDDVWRAINHTEINPTGNTPNSSHVIWYWDAAGGRPNSAPIHNISYIGSVYANITDYCLSSCHDPIISSGTPPPSLSEVVHVSRRISCYDCHTNTYSFTVLSKPRGTSSSPPWPNSDTGDMDNFDVNVFKAPLIVHGDTCISCKRAGAPNSGNFLTYTEPSNVMYYNGGII